MSGTKLFNRVLSLLVAVCMVVAIFPLTAFAGGKQTSVTVENLDLTSESTSEGSLDEDGYSWDSDAGVLCLKNVKITEQLTLPKNLKTVLVYGTVEIEMLYFVDGNKLGQEIKGDDSSKLTVKNFYTSSYSLTLSNINGEIGFISNGAGYGSLNVIDSDIVINSLSWIDCIEYQNEGLKLTNSKLKLADDYGSAFVGRIEIDDVSSITLVDTRISNYGNISNGLDNLSDCLDEGYSIGTYGESITILDKNGEPATNLVIKRNSTFSVDVSFDVTQNGDVAPTKTDFVVEPLESSLSSEYKNIEVSGGSVTTDGMRTYDVTMTFSGKTKDMISCFADGMFFHQKNGGKENWEYDETVWSLCLVEKDSNSDSADSDNSSYVMAIYPTDYEIGENGKRCYYTVKDNGCAEKLSFNNVYSATSDTHNHNYSQNNDENNHWDECECGDKKDVEPHDFGEWKVTKEASTTEKGEKERICSVCGYKETVEIPMLSNESTKVADDNKKSPKTGAENDMTVLLAIALIGGGVLIATGAYGKKKKLFVK